MNPKWIGAILIIASCSGFGVSLTIHHVRELQLLKTLSRILDDMLSELTYQLTPLPLLSEHAFQKAPAPLRNVFAGFQDQLERQILPDVGSCMERAVEDTAIPFEHVKKTLLALGYSLGRFDLPGQIRSLNAVQRLCRDEITALRNDSPDRLRSYRILGLCAGIALAIFLI